MIKKIKIAGLIIILLGCSTEREDILFEAFTEPFFDWYSLKLYSDGKFDLHIPSIDYTGKYKVSGDTILLKSIESELRATTTTVDGIKSKKIVEEQWTFLIESKEERIRSIGNTIQ